MQAVAMPMYIITLHYAYNYYPLMHVITIYYAFIISLYYAYNCYNCYHAYNYTIYQAHIFTVMHTIRLTFINHCHVHNYQNYYTFNNSINKACDYY